MLYCSIEYIGGVEPCIALTRFAWLAATKTGSSYSTYRWDDGSSWDYTGNWYGEYYTTLHYTTLHYTTLHYHINQPGHDLSNLKIAVLEQVKSEDTLYRKEREKYFINKFNTFYRGINKQV